jgi:hypothetical protein
MLPLCPLTMLHLSGRYHCVSYESRRWRGPRVSCSCGRGMAPHSPRPCTVRLSFPGTLVGSRILALVPVPDPPPSRSFSGGHVARTPPWRANPIPSFLLSPTRTSPGSVPWRCCSPPRVPLVIPLHMPPFPVRCATTSVHQIINATLLASPPSHLLI